MPETKPINWQLVILVLLLIVLGLVITIYLNIKECCADPVTLLPEEEFVGLWNVRIECPSPEGPHHETGDHGPVGDARREPHGAQDGYYAIYPKPDGTYGFMASKEFANWDNLDDLQNWNNLVLTYVPGNKSDRPSGTFDCSQGISGNADKLTGTIALHDDDVGAPVDHDVDIWLHENSNLHDGDRAPIIWIDHTEAQVHRGVLH